MTLQVHLMPYQQVWAEEFAAESAQLRKLLDASLLALEHIGSTSIPGLIAKPALDIAAGVHVLEDGLRWMEPLQQVGYEYVPKPGWSGRLFFRKGLWRQGTHHLHVYQIDSAEWQNLLLFRDYLRNHPAAREQYAKLKQTLAEQFADDRAAYTAHKAPFIQSILQIARQANSN